MFTVWFRENEVHKTGIWSCAWGRRKLNEENDNGNEIKEKDKKLEENKKDVKPEIKDKTVDNKNKEDNKIAVKDAEDNSDYIEYIATGGADDLVKVWQLDDDQLVLKYTLEGHCLAVLSVAISNNGKILASSSMDGTIQLWDLTTGESIGDSINAHPWALAFSPDDKLIVTGNHKGRILFYNVETQQLAKSLQSWGKFIMSVAYSPDGKYVASGDCEGFLTLYRVDEIKLIAKSPAHSKSIRTMCFTPDSQQLVTGSDDKLIKMFNVTYGECIWSIEKHSAWVLSVALSPDGIYMATGDSENCVFIWELATRDCVHRFDEHTEPVWSVKYSPDGTKILSVGDDSMMAFYKCFT